MIPLIQIYTYC